MVLRLLAAPLDTDLDSTDSARQKACMFSVFLLTQNEQDPCLNEKNGKPISIA